MPNGHKRTPSDAAKFAQFAQFAQGPLSPSFPEADALLSLFKNSCTQLSDLRTQVFFWIVNSWKVFYMGLFFYTNLLCLSKIDGRLYNVKREVATQDSKHRKTLAEVR